MPNTRFQIILHFNFTFIRVPLPMYFIILILQTKAEQLKNKIKMILEEKIYSRQFLNKKSLASLISNIIIYYAHFYFVLQVGVRHYIMYTAAQGFEFLSQIYRGASENKNEYFHYKSSIKRVLLYVPKFALYVFILSTHTSIQQHVIVLRSPPRSSVGCRYRFEKSRNRLSSAGRIIIIIIIVMTRAYGLQIVVLGIY